MAAWLAAATAWAGLKPVELRCEYLKDPLGIDVPNPALAWQLQGKASARGQAQTAYQVLVASSEERLGRDEGDLWDSGKVMSDRSIQVAYDGRLLATHQRYFWKVRAWDQDGSVTPWSKAACWSMGLLTPNDWKGKWIGLDEVETAPSKPPGNWIWFPEGEPAQAAPAGTRYFRVTVTVPEGQKVTKGQLAVTADNEFTAWLNGKRLGSGGDFHALTVFPIGEALTAGANALAVEVKNAGDNPNPAGLFGSVTVELANGQRIELVADGSWKCAQQASGDWQAKGFDDSGWSAAKVLGAAGIAPWGPLGQPEENKLPARQLRREFTVEKKVARATAYISGLGLSELYLNGQKVGDDVLSPALSEYPKRVFYVTHDVTDLVSRGANAVGVWLGNGRYYAPRAKQPTSTVSYGYPKVLLQLRLDYADGSSENIVSDEAWRLSTSGPIQANNEYDGEDYDARREMPGWAKAGFDDRTWLRAQIVAAPEGRLRAQTMPPIRVTERLKAKTISQPQAGVFIVDMGQNMVGWCRLKVKGAKGTTVTLRHAEVLKPDGTLYLDNIRSAKVTDRYTLKGQGTEVYEPRFTYHGFRYVEITGYPGTPTLDTLEGRVVHDDLEIAGTWECSNPLLNRIYGNVRWGVRGNYRSISTDCPQRDERQGWLGDRSSESKGETFLYQTVPLYRKWVEDMGDSQKENGSVPDVCPPYWPIYSDNITWPSSTVIIPGHLYEQYGEVGLIRRHYPSMRKWIDFMTTFLKDDLMPRDTYGDWCVPPEDPKLIHSQDPMRKTHPTIMGTTYYYHCLTLMERYAGMVGEAQDAQRYRQLAERVKTAFNRQFLKPDGSQYDNGSQTSCILPLAFGMVPPEHEAKIVAHLIEKIRNESKEHVGTGLIGGQYLMRMLTEHGYAELAATLATQKTYPSWGYMVEKGATTIWELWNGDTADPAMNSGNHVMLVGDLIIWLNESIAGIKADPACPGFKHIIMRPNAVRQFDYVRATHRSPHGLIASEWQRKDGQLRWQIAVPVNTTATVYVPTGSVDKVTEHGKPAAHARGLEFLRQEGGYAVFTAGSGKYEFCSEDQP